MGVPFSVERGGFLSGEQKEESAKNIINALYAGGYIDFYEKRVLEYRLTTGDRTVYDKIRRYLYKIADDIKK